MVRLSRDGVRSQILHPLHAQLFVKFDTTVANTPANRRQHLIAPVGYHSFAAFFNSWPVTQWRYRMCQFEEMTQTWNVPNERVPPNVIRTVFVDPKYKDLTSLGLIDKRTGLVDETRVKLINTALYQPFANIQRREYYRMQKEAEYQPGDDDLFGQGDNHEDSDADFFFNNAVDELASIHFRQPPSPPPLGLIASPN
ncbi:hypothetical protein H0H93_004157 [Arthromyces matolae]|nr:hypothetical protein H0H93_004157 [Arthromyces matolae]